MRYLFCLLTLLCFACQERTSSHPYELYHKLESGAYSVLFNVDSIISLTQKIDPTERYAILCLGMRTSNKLLRPEIAASYLKELNTLPFPEVKDKETGLLLMKQFSHGAFDSKMVDLKNLSSLLFDMENRFNLTPEERFDFLTLKAGIYIHIFREYESGGAIAARASDFGHQSGISGKKLYSSFLMQYRYHMYVEDPSGMIHIAHRLLENPKSQLDDSTTRVIYAALHTLYFKQKKYEEAYTYWMKSKKQEQSIFCSDVFIEILQKTNRITELMDYLDRDIVRAHERFKENKAALHVTLGGIAWAKANVYLERGDTNKYEHHLREAFDHFTIQHDIEGLRPIETIEAYARLLWKQGKRDQATRVMELLTQKVIKYGPSSYRSLNFNIIKKRLEVIRLTADYYSQTGRTADALRQMQLYDTLKTENTNTLLQEKERKNANQIYVADLHHRLDLRTIQYKQERQKLFFTFTLLGIAVVIALVFGKLYYRRKEELNKIYARQKKMERMEAFCSTVEAAENQDEIPADKLLYLRLQKQMYEEKLFLKPDFSRNDLCRLVGSNRMYVSTCINKYAEMNINLWINKARVNHSIQLIHSGETNLQELARASGFSSISTFYRSFKYFTLLSPKQYIERETQQENLDLLSLPQDEDIPS